MRLTSLTSRAPPGASSPHRMVDSSMTAPAKRPSALLRVLAALTLRCPGCLRGHIFRGPFTMEERCQTCGYSFARAPGDYLGAMYFSYPLAFTVLGAIALVTQLLAPDLSWFAI